ncbi:hypothetical protein [Aromatoleum evansii]|uniref:hypothetical protein n=1 Tax=Aromatoleum evansii TaxID=59406 RepID=UPI00145E69BE|nr:hypothetical protein [Aromatoleum evansii]
MIVELLSVMHFSRIISIWREARPTLEPTEVRPFTGGSHPDHLRQLVIINLPRQQFVANPIKQVLYKIKDVSDA